MKKIKELMPEAYDFNGKLSLKQAIPLGLQHVMAMFVGNLTPLLIITGACGIGAGSEYASIQVALLQNAMIIAGIVTMANSGKGNQATAMEHARRAVELDPDNMQYRMFYQRMNSGGEWYSGRQQTYQNPAGGMGSWCMKLIFINLMCNCCLGGGGLCCPGRYY